MSADAPKTTSWLRSLAVAEVQRPAWVPSTQPEEVPPEDPMLVAERAALIATRQEMQACITAYCEATMRLGEAKKALVSQSINALTELAFSVGKELALRELRADPDALSELIRRTATELAASSPVNVKVSPEDYARIAEQMPESGVTLTQDATLSLGSCIITGTNGNLTTTLEERERVVREALRIAEQAPLRKTLSAVGTEGNTP